MYRNPCRHCGANLDPGEICDCMKEEDSLKLSVQESYQGGTYTKCILSKQEKKYRLN